MLRMRLVLCLFAFFIREVKFRLVLPGGKGYNRNDKIERSVSTMSSSQDGTTSPKSLFGWYKEHITGAIASFAALATMAGCVVLKERIRLDD